MATQLLDNVSTSPRHTSFYLSCGPKSGTPIIFMHGWPELSIIWRRQLEAFGRLGFHAIAPDMRGYGRSSINDRQDAYRQECVVEDMLELLNSLGHKKAIWVGHDWGSATLWALAQHHPDQCHGVASLCVPYVPGGFAPESLIPLVDRKLYPEKEYPAGQWDYQLYYRESFSKAVASYDGDVGALVRAVFRSPDTTGVGKPYYSATIRARGGLFGEGNTAPDVPRDPEVLSEEDEHIFTAALRRGGFFGPTSWYMNGDADRAYAARGAADLAMPVLFLHASYDYGCWTHDGPLVEPMRAHCADLSEAVIGSGHWMSQEKPLEVNAALARWLAARFGDLWLQN